MFASVPYGAVCDCRYSRVLWYSNSCTRYNCLELGYTSAFRKPTWTQMSFEHTGRFRYPNGVRDVVGRPHGFRSFPLW